MKNLFIILLLIPLSSFCQIIEDFSDGNFTSNPEWSGDTSQFKVNNNFQLQLDGSDSDTSTLSIQTNMSGEIEWNIWIKLSFAPSDNNNLRVYLLANNQDLKSPLNGYFIKLGENGADDSIDLYRQDSLSTTKIIDGISGQVSGTTNTFNLKITRDSQFNWGVQSDINNPGIFNSTGTVIDSTYLTGSVFGIFCKYTSSNSTKFYFDKIYIGDIQIDTVSPYIIKADFTEEKNISINFSEAITNLSINNSLNYFLEDLNIYPSQIENINPSEITLKFDLTFQPDKVYKIQVSNLEDLSGNILSDTIIEFSYSIPQENDIIINEILADPYPPVDLPEAEYIEIYNASGNDLNLVGYKIKIGETVKQLPDIIFPKNSYKIICHSNFEDSFDSEVSVIIISGFPSLTNSGQTISIITSDDEEINSVSYSNSWYQDIDKENGGWSLEKIDPRNNCSKELNWKASLNISGGTPGIENSIISLNQDLSPPEIVQLKVLDSTTLKLETSESILSFGELDNDYFKIEGSGVNPYNVTLDSEKTLYLYFDSIFEEEKPYSISIKNLIDNCGNIMNDTSISFIRYIPSFGDLLITEIMYDYEPQIDLPLSDYIEILNRSEYPINLGDNILWIEDKEIYFPDIEIDSQEYIVLCPEGNASMFGPFINSIEILGSNDLTNTGKALAITDKHGELISSLSYETKWHSSNYKSEGGWSLERIDTDNICEGKENWSSSESEFGGTPGKQNSINSSNLDLYNPYPIRAQYLDSSSIRIIFSEQMDLSDLSSTKKYNTSNNLGIPIQAQSTSFLNNSIDLNFAEQLSDNIIYKIMISDVSDCAGNINSIDTIYFGIPKKAKQLDIVINEILFNPVIDGVDYIEVYNRSDKIVDISNLLIATKSDGSSEYESIKEIASSNYLLMPANYIVFTSSKENVITNYFYSNSNAFLTPDIQIPTMANTSGRIILLNKQEFVIDDFSYSEDMHHSLLNSFEGVSLERINYNSETNDIMNWHSASETFGFGTPGIMNSQYSDQIPGSSSFNVEPEIFSPDNDGTDDFLSISYSFKVPGNVGSISVYDSRGSKNKDIIINSLLGTEETFIWDGTNNAGERCGIGIYIILFEYFTPSGKTKSFKKICVLARKI